MNTLKYAYWFSLIFLMFSCSTQREPIMDNSGCARFNIASSTEYLGTNLTVAKQFEDFNASHKTLDIIRVISSFGYDYNQHLKRVYIEKDTAFLVEDKIKYKLSDNAAKELKIFHTTIDTINTVISCRHSSSIQNNYRFFVKLNGKLVMSFYSNSLPAKINPSLIETELRYLEIFEELK